MDALKARPEINSGQTTFNPSFPQYMLDIDAAACKKAGISPSDILTTMQGYFGGLYAVSYTHLSKGSRCYYICTTKIGYLHPLCTRRKLLSRTFGL